MGIIGISGHISSGKDTVGKIIQYLTAFENNCGDRPAIEGFLQGSHTNFVESLSGWQIKRFAGKVKEICSILTGIPVADFEKQEVKDRILGEEWNYINYMGNDRVSVEDTIRYIFDDIGEYATSSFIKSVTKSLTVRELLQQVGTDAMRNVIHPNVWVNALFADYKVQGEINVGKTYSTKDLPNWIITDTRFPNEAKAIKNRDGILIRINRNDYIFNDSGKRIIPTKEYNNISVDQHPSETALDNYKFDYTIDNNGTIEELIEKVRIILIKEKTL